MEKFDIGSFYTRNYLSKHTGGSSVHYLPYNKYKKVVCVAVRPEINPDAPHIICVTNVQTTIYLAKIFYFQKEFVPLFIKRNSNSWEYMGEFRVITMESNENTIKKYANMTNKNISFLLYLEK